jgi:NhaP-type Na+/H+ or K+/H+ antiporter
VNPDESYNINFLIKDFIWIFILYVLVIFTRFACLLVLSWLLHHDIIGWKESLLMAWGEIPGPINIVMALIVLLGK